MCEYDECNTKGDMTVTCTVDELLDSVSQSWLLCWGHIGQWFDEYPQRFDEDFPGQWKIVLVPVEKG